MLPPNLHIPLQDITSRQNRRRNSHTCKKAFGGRLPSDLGQPYTSNTGHFSTVFGFEPGVSWSLCVLHLFLAGRAPDLRRRSVIRGGGHVRLHFIFSWTAFENSWNPRIETEMGPQPNGHTELAVVYPCGPRFVRLMFPRISVELEATTRTYVYVQVVPPRSQRKPNESGECPSRGETSDACTYERTSSRATADPGPRRRRQ